MKEFIKKVATGPKGNEDLTFEEAKSVMSMILSSDYSDVEKASFLVGWRLKPETIEEFKGAYEAILEKTIRHEVVNSFELGFPFDGKNDSPYLFPLIAKILKEEGVNIVVTGDERIPAKNGITTKDLHSNLIKKINSVDYVYQDRSVYLNEYSKLTNLRNLIGLRTALNTLEKVSGVSKSNYAATGVFHKPYVEKYASVFEDKLTRLLLVSGNEGSPEIAKKSKYWIISNGVREEFIIDPMDFGIESIYRENGYSLQEHLSIAIDPSENILKMACLNAAIYLYVINPNTSVDSNYSKLSGRLK